MAFLLRQPELLYRVLSAHICTKYTMTLYLSPGTYPGSLLSLVCRVESQRPTVAWPPSPSDRKAEHPSMILDVPVGQLAGRDDSECALRRNYLS